MLLRQGAQTTGSASIAVGPQYDTTHVYVAPEDFDRFVASLLATFGGTTTKQGVFTVTPTSEQHYVTTGSHPRRLGVRVRIQNADPLSVRLGAHRLSGHRHGRGDPCGQGDRRRRVQVAPFNDPIGRDAIIQWPGGVNTQLYWHTDYAVLSLAPDNSGESGVRLSQTEWMPSSGAFLLSLTEASSRMKRKRQALKSDGLRKPTAE